MTVACLKTAVGLITSCGKTFVKLFPGGPSYPVWAVGFCVLSFLIANLGLDAIIAYTVPVLMFLYPLAIVLIILTFCHRFFGGSRCVYQWTIGCTAVGAVCDALRQLPAVVSDTAFVKTVTDAALEVLPFSRQGFGWVCPALIGAVIGLLVCHISGRAVAG